MSAEGSLYEDALTWTDPVTDEYVGERCGCGAKMARIMIADAVLRGLVLAKPAKSGSWHYNLPVDGAPQ